MSVEKISPNAPSESESRPKDTGLNMPSVKAELHDEEVQVRGSIAAVEADNSAVPDRLTGMKLRGTTFA